MVPVMLKPVFKTENHLIDTKTFIKQVELIPITQKSSVGFKVLYAYTAHTPPYILAWRSAQGRACAL